jgi:hypothetical protein
VQVDIDDPAGKGFKDIIRDKPEETRKDYKINTVFLKYFKD